MRTTLSRLPIQSKLTLLTLLVCALALLVACGTLFTFEAFTFRENFTRDLETLSQVIAGNSTAALTFKDKQSAEEVLGALRVKPEVVDAEIELNDGAPFAKYVSDKNNKPIDWKEYPDGLTKSGRYILLAKAIRLDGKQLGTLRMAADYAGVHAGLMRVYGGILVTILIASILLAYLLSARLQKIISQPILNLAKAARTVAEKSDYTVRVAKRAEDEVGQLTDAFNHMLAQTQAKDEALEKSRQRFELAVLGSSDGIWDWDLVTDTLYFSPRWKTMIGFADHEIENKIESLERRLHPDDRAQFSRNLKEVLSGHANVFRMEFRVLQKDGVYRWILSRGALLRDKSGKPVRLAGSHTDISEHKRSEEVLRFARQKFESLVNSINSIVWEADAETMTMWFVSAQAEQMLGYPISMWLEEPGFIASKQHPDDRARVAETMRRHLQSGEPFHVEYRLHAAGGEIVWVQDNISVLLDEGKPVLLRGVMLNITAQKLAAEQLEKTQKELVTASRQAGMAEVATGVLHNVGNVLNSVNVSASLVSESLRRSKIISLEKVVLLLEENKASLGDFIENDPRGKLVPELLAQLSQRLRGEHSSQMKEAESLARNIGLIKDIVAMQQNHAKVSGVLEPLSIASLVDDTLEMNKAPLIQQGVEIIREFREVPPVMADKYKILQILTNLVRNARHAMRDASVQNKRLMVKIHLNGNERVKIEVKDSGIGIAQENIHKIFAHGFTTKKDGHGFGLHSCALAAKEMGGSLLAESDGPGTGATFVLELPIRKVAAP